MIIVLVPHAGALKVFAASAEEVVAMVSDTSETGSYVASLPPGVIAGEFEAAWIRLTIDLRHARHFDTVDDAWQYYALNSYQSTQCTIHKHPDRIECVGDGGWRWFNGCS